MDTQTTTDQKTCSACKYWDSSDNEKGSCHRMSPQTVTLQVSDTQQIQTVFPATSASDWCGEFDAK